MISMYTDRASGPASEVCDDSQGDEASSELIQTPQQHTTCSGPAERCRIKPLRRRRALRNNHTYARTGLGVECSEKALDMQLMCQEADLENQLRVNQTLQRVQQAAHRDLLFVQDRIARFQAGCRQLEVQNQYLQQAILELTSTVGMHGPHVAHVAPVGGHMDGEDADADESSGECSADLVHAPFSEAA